MPVILGINVLVIAAAVALFVAIVLITRSVDAFIVERRGLSQRLALQGDLAPILKKENEPARILLEDTMLKRVADFLTPTDQEELAAGRQRLVRAGYRSPAAIRVYNAAKPVLAITLALLALLIAAITGKFSAPAQLIIAIVAGAIGFFLPFLWVERLVEKRKEEAELAFPDVLDMLLICIEAGSGIDHATRRVATEIRGVSKVLSDEFAVINSELWAGKDRATVFRDFADRLGVNDIKAFATVLRQSDEFGVSIAEALRVYAADMRLKRVMRAEEKANTMPVKVALGSILFTVPPTMTIIAGPSFVVMMKFFGVMN